FWLARVLPAISSRSILANLAAGTCGFRGIDSGRSCPNIRGGTGSKSAGAGCGSASQDADYWSACRSNRMAPPALSKLRQHVFLPMTSRSECLVRSISPRIPNTLWFASTPQALAQHWQAPNRVWSEARLAHSEERPATRRRSMLRLMAAFLFPTKVASRTPSSYGWKSANQAGPCCKECDGNDPHSHPRRLSKCVAGDGRLVTARRARRHHRFQ